MDIIGDNICVYNSVIRDLTYMKYTIIKYMLPHVPLIILEELSIVP